jgi:putative glycosyltransferase TIGR03111
MHNILSLLSNQVFFWIAWIIIPLIMEIIPGLFGFLMLVKKRIAGVLEKELDFYPQITLIVPVYNSAATLEECLRSIVDTGYPADKMTILAVNNGSMDNSFEIFMKCQAEYPDYDMTWMNAEQGKAKALNMALFHSSGKYIIHIDSDGILHKDALKNMVMRFENREDIDCMTGTILTNPDLIREEKTIFGKLLKKVEFYEYAQAFLAGRNFQADFNNIFTLSGAFSAFRKSTILKTRLYSTETVCEDTQITFQVRKLLKGRIAICEKALFFVDPIESAEKLYLQRQRWQRGEIEVAHMFEEKKGRLPDFFSNFMTRILMYDHTFAFPRMIWYFALFCLTFMDYPFRYIMISVGAIYAFYVISAFLYYLTICSYLNFDKKLLHYYGRNVLMIFLLPIFNFWIFWVRFAGIINSIKGQSSWRTKTFGEEIGAVRSVLKKDLERWYRITGKIKQAIQTGK